MRNTENAVDIFFSFFELSLELNVDYLADSSLCGMALIVE